MDKVHLKVKILGTTFSIQSNENKDQLEEIIEYYKTKINEINEKAVIADPLKLAIIAGLNVVDELFREREKKNSAFDEDPNTHEIKKITDRMIHKIDATLNQFDDK